MIDFKDVTFIVPIKFDSEDRKTNFKISMRYILRNFDTNIIVMESDVDSNEEFVKSVSEKINYHFVKNDTGIFHRTKLLNDMTKLSTTNIVVNYDVDVIFPINQYVESRGKMLEGCSFCFPYSGNFYDIPKEFFNLIESEELSSINLSKCTLFNPNSVGGAFFFDKLKYLSIGLENEKFISWGFEDWERILRIQKMGFELYRVNGILYHLTHFRDKNSGDKNPYLNQNQSEFNKVKGMDKLHLEEYIKTWEWI